MYEYNRKSKGKAFYNFDCSRFTSGALSFRNEILILFLFTQNFFEKKFYSNIFPICFESKISRSKSSSLFDLCFRLGKFELVPHFRMFKEVSREFS